MIAPIATVVANAADSQIIVEQQPVVVWVRTDNRAIHTHQTPVDRIRRMDTIGPHGNTGNFDTTGSCETLANHSRTNDALIEVFIPGVRPSEPVW